MPSINEQVARFNILGAYGGENIVVNTKAQQLTMSVDVGRDKNITINFFTANFDYAIQAIARSAYEKGRFDEKMETKEKMAAFFQGNF